MASGCGGVLRDNAGNWVTGFYRGLGMGSVLGAELWGILVGLQVAWDRGIQKLWIESDSLTSVNLVKRGCSLTQTYYNLVQSILELCGRSWQVHITHSHREGNRVADILANDGACSGFYTTVLNSPPQHIVNTLRDDTSGASMPRLVAASSL